MGARAALQHAITYPTVWDAIILISANAGIEDEIERSKRAASDHALAQQRATCRRPAHGAALMSRLSWLKPCLFCLALLVPALWLAVYLIGFSLAYVTLDAGVGALILFACVQVTMLPGADKDLVELHWKAFEAMGNRVFHMGPLGSSSIIKVITNMLAFIHLKACAEALMLAKRGGLDLGQAWHAIAASSGTSFVHETEGALILNGSYDIAFNIDLALKDLGFALNFGKEFGVPLELASMTNQTYVAAKAAFGGDAQSPMIAKLLEDQLGTDLRAPGFPARLE